MIPFNEDEKGRRKDSIEDLPFNDTRESNLIIHPKSFHHHKGRDSNTLFFLKKIFMFLG
jgi:hypothetical protein